MDRRFSLTELGGGMRGGEEFILFFHISVG
jgi:hypothetical protein